MDVGNPSNFVRMLELYDHSVENMRQDIVGYSFSDDATRMAIKEVYKRHGYILDPHGAVAISDSKNTRKNMVKEYRGIFLPQHIRQNFSTLSNRLSMILYQSLSDCRNI